MGNKTKLVWYKRLWRLAFKIAVFLCLPVCCLSFSSGGFPYRYPLMLLRLIDQVEEGKDLRLVKDWEPLENIAPSLQLAVVVCEDQNF